MFTNLKTTTQNVCFLHYDVIHCICVMIVRWANVFLTLLPCYLYTLVWLVYFYVYVKTICVPLRVCMLMCICVECLRAVRKHLYEVCLVKCHTQYLTTYQKVDGRHSCWALKNFSYTMFMHVAMEEDCPYANTRFVYFYKS